MKTKISALLLLISFTCIVILSCSKVKESIERDLFITAPDFAFTIPVVDSTTSGAILGNLEIKQINLDSLISNQSSAKFGSKNIKNIKIKQFKLKLLDADSANNIQNIGNIIIKLSSATEKSRSIATTTPSNSRTDSLIVPILADSSDVKSFLTAPPFTYNLTGTMRTITKKPIKAKAIITYTFTVSL